MKLSEELEFKRFEEWWFQHPYRARFSESTTPFQICWKAWYKQTCANTQLLEWNRELVRASEYGA